MTSSLKLYKTKNLDSNYTREQTSSKETYFINEFSPPFWQSFASQSMTRVFRAIINQTTVLALASLYEIYCSHHAKQNFVKVTLVLQKCGACPKLGFHIKRFLPMYVASDNIM